MCRSSLKEVLLARKRSYGGGGVDNLDMAFGNGLAKRRFSQPVFPEGERLRSICFALVLTGDRNVSFRFLSTRKEEACSGRGEIGS